MARTTRNVDPQVAHHRATVATRVKAGADPDLIDAARADLKAANLEAGIRAAVSTWPPLTDQARAELALLLTGTDGDAA